MFIVLIIWLLFGLWGCVVGNKKNKGTLGLILGIAFGIFGVIAIYYIIKGDKESTRLRTQVEQAELRVKLAQLEREQYDAVMRAAQPELEQESS